MKKFALFCALLGSLTLTGCTPSTGPGETETLRDFEDLVFEDRTFEYDGYSHSLEVENVPSGAKVTYKNNNKTEPGSYNVKATVSKKGYNTASLEAVLTIGEKKTFTGITFSDLTVDYDGKSHSIYVEGKPEEASVSYAGNNKTNPGVYNVTAKVTQRGYVDLNLQAKLTIKPLDFSDLKFESKVFEYDGKAHKIEVENLPTGAAVTYTNNEKIQIGVYNAKAVVSKTGYNSKTLTATLTIAEPVDPIGVDSGKTPLPLNQDTTYDELLENLYKGNYTLDIENGQRNLYHENGVHDVFTKVEYEKYSNLRVASTIDQYYVKRIGESSNDDYRRYVKKVGDYAFGIVVGENEDGGFYKIPGEYFAETYAKQEVSTVFKFLQRTDTNGFEPRPYVHYYTYRSNITFENNKVTIEYYKHIEHYDSHDTEEVTFMRFYNIGNTTLSIQDAYIGKVEEADNYSLGYFVNQGIGYQPNKNTIEANLTIDNGELTYLEDKNLYLLPEVYGSYVNQISLDFYIWDHHTYDGVTNTLSDLTGYTLTVEFNESMKYGLKYKQYGYIQKDIYRNSKYYLNVLESQNCVVNYHNFDSEDIGFFQDRTTNDLTNLDKYNLSIINAANYTDEQIDTVQATGTRVISYINAGQISKSDPNYSKFESITFKDVEDKPNYRWVDASKDSWVSYIDGLIDESLAKGVDGFYFDGFYVYDEMCVEKLDSYNARNELGGFVYKGHVDDDDPYIIMVHNCEKWMNECPWGGSNRNAPYKVDYYVHDQVFTKIEDEFVAQDSEVTSTYQAILTGLLVDYVKLQVVLLEYTTDSAMKDTINSYCNGVQYHYFVSDSVTLD